MNFLTHIPVIFQSIRQSQRGCDKTQKCFVTAPFPFYKKDGGHSDTCLSVFAGQGVPALLTFPYYTMIFKGDLFVLGAAV